MQLGGGTTVSSIVASGQKAAMAPSVRAIFLVFLKMGAFAFGGVYSMLSFFQRELVEKRRWLSQEEFNEGTAIGQMTPGPPIVNVGVFVGYHLRGARGALAATAGQVLPGFVLVLVLAFFYRRLTTVPVLAHALRGIGAAVVGLLGSVIVKMGRQTLTGPGAVAFAAGGVVLFGVLRVNPLALIALAGLLGYLVWGRGR